MRQVFTILVLIIAVSCQKNEVRQPEQILPRKKMIEVLVDFQIAEAAIQKKQQSKQDVKFYSQYYYNTVFQKHGISRKQFIANIAYYQDHMDELDKMYAVVLNKLSKMQGTDHQAVKKSAPEKNN